jgi:hypothetical protein
MDAQTGRGGRANIRVLLDGKPVDIGSGEIGSNSPSRDLNVSLGEARELTLVVEFGAGGDVCDHVNWAEARVVK